MVLQTANQYGSDAEREPTKMDATLAAIHRDHINAVKLLDLLEQRLANLDTLKTPDYIFMTDIMRYMTDYPDVFHHPKEDLILDRLVELYPDAGPMQDDLKGDHLEISSLGGRLRKRLQDASVTPTLPRQPIALMTRDYVALMRYHIDKEEALFLPLATRVLAHDDWLDIESTLPASHDPVFGTDADLEYRALFVYLNEHQPRPQPSGGASN